MALWFPDWPVQAVRLNREDTEEQGQPLAIAAHHRIKVCGHSARRRGVRRGMKVRQAQAVCPELTVVEDDPERDARLFEGIVASLGEVAPSVEVLRPGLVVISADAAARYHGSEEIAAQMLISAASLPGVDIVAGIADEINTAVIATRVADGGVVGDGASISFLRAQPLGVLVAEEALGCAREVVDALGDLGIQTLGDLADLPVGSVATRFGNPGLRCHDIATARQARTVAPPIDHVDWEVSHVPGDPIQRIDVAAFMARNLAVQLHARLAEAGVVCQLLKVTADFTDGTSNSRLWRTTELLTEAATADRVRWQLDGWLTARGVTDEDDQGGITALWLTPLECVPPAVASDGLWDTGTSQRAVARQVIERVQSTLGITAVLQPVPTGGRGIAEGITLVPFGDKPDQVRNPEGTWSGRLPAPLPARLGGGINHPASQVVLISATGTPVSVTAEVLLNDAPYALGWGARRYLVTGWAGPWPVDDHWWAGDGQRYARLQVVGRAVDQEAGLGAWLLIWMKGRWRIEAIY
ncbi:Y-family DNA polymerase [Corynebacterium faecale]|uniref:Y-family DNA polymerase n=1 Tax=Corynebacterium faecale TaxID=1758466 RepID=UPI0025B45C85|nr:DNA polymerase Y family protein [Corynebacterium faecale]